LIPLDGSVIFARRRKCAPLSSIPKSGCALYYCCCPLLSRFEYINYWARPGLAPIPLRIAPSCVNLNPCNKSFLRPTHIIVTNGLAIGSAIFAGLTIVTDRPRYSVCSNKLHLASAAMWQNRWTCLLTCILVSNMIIVVQLLSFVDSIIFSSIW